MGGDILSSCIVALPEAPQSRSFRPEHLVYVPLELLEIDPAVPLDRILPLVKAVICRLICTTLWEWYLQELRYPGHQIKMRELVEGNRFGAPSDEGLLAETVLWQSRR